jgi:ferredoxin
LSIMRFPGMRFEPQPCFHRQDRVKYPSLQLPTYRRHFMKVWIDQDLCTGDGLCEEIAPDVFTLLDDGLAYVREGDKIYATAKGNPQGAEGMADIPDGQLDAVIESAEECPGECIFIEA